MSKKLTAAFGLVLGAASLGIMAPAEASLVGTVDINPQVRGGVILEGIGFQGGNGNPLTNIDFLPPPGGGVGGVVELNALSDSDFEPFIGWEGTFQDLQFPDGICTVCTTEGAVFPGLPPALGGPTPAVPAWAVIDEVADGDPVPGSGGFLFDLLDLGLPVYTQDTAPGGGVSTTVSIAVTVVARKLDESGNIIGDPNTGTGTLSADFAGFTADEVRALFDEPGEIPLDSNGNPLSFPYSSQFVFPDKNVPESSNTIGIIALGLAGATMAIAKKRKQNL